MTRSRRRSSVPLRTSGLKRTAKGLFTGSEGEWVIFRKADEPETDIEASKESDEPEDNEEKKTKIKSGEQQL
jgi:hypothetical protein